MNGIVFNHPGLGDHIISNAIVRDAAAKFDRVVVPVREDYMKATIFMFSDLSNIYFVPCASDHSFHVVHERYLMEGYTDINLWGSGGLKFDEVMYERAGLPFEKRWSGFHCPRNIDGERRVNQEIVGHEEPYIFLHESGGTIDRSKVRSDLRVVTPRVGLTDVAFDYRLVIERATELHFVNSCFALFADSLPNQYGPKAYLHKYARISGGTWCSFRNFTIIE